MSRSIFWHSAVIFTVAAAASLSSLDADASQVWGVLPSANRIVQVNPATGEILGGFTPPGGALERTQQFGGLTFAEHGKTLLYQNPLTNPSSLFRLDPRTGAVRSREFMPEASPEPDFRAGLSFHSRAGIGGVDAIYAVNDGGPIQRQDGYGNPALVEHAATNVTIAGALGGDDNGRHFIVAGQEIQEFHPFYSDLIIGMVPLPPGVMTVGGLAFDGTSIYLSDMTGRLFTIDPASGDVQRTARVQGGMLIGLAARPIPEPATAILAAASGLLFVLAGRRRWAR